MIKETKFKPGIITVYVTGEIKEAKYKLGINWRGLIIRGIQSCTRQPVEEINELKQKHAKLVQKVQSQALKIYNLENKE